MAAGVFTLRNGTLFDRPALTQLIAASARALSRNDYSAAQIEGALGGAFGVDTQLIRDGSYFVIEAQGRIAACGGWSRRRTLFGGDARADRDAGELDPAVDAAKIRAFFIHPDFVRQGLGTMLLEHCEREAMARGFRRFEMMATLPGVRLYAARGYVPGAPVEWPLGAGLSITFVPMSKRAPAASCEILRATLSDAQALLELQRLAYQSEARLYDDFALPPLTQTLESLLDEIARAVVLKAVQGARLVGSVRAHASEGVCHVGRLIVTPDLQRRGIATQLMAQIEREFPQTRKFEVFTGSRSAGNIRLYEQLGYVPAREKILSPAVTLVFMEKVK